MELHDFPFDVQQLRIYLETISHWRQLDSARWGSSPRGYSYVLQPVSRPSEGRLMWLMWDGTIYEWRFHSYSVRLSRVLNPAGFTATRLELTLHIHRKFEHYLYKTLLPLWFIVCAAFSLQLVPARRSWGACGPRAHNVHRCVCVAVCHRRLPA